MLHEIRFHEVIRPIAGRRHVTLVLAAAVLQIFWQDPGQAAELTPSQLYQRALNYDAAVKIAQRERRMAAEALPQALAGLLPTARYDGRIERTLGKGRLAARQENPSRGEEAVPGYDLRRPVKETSGQFEVSLPILNVSDWFAVAKARHVNAQGVAGQEKALQDAGTRLSNALFELLGTSDLLVAADVELSAVREQVARTQAGLANGTNSSVEALGAIAELSRVQAERIEIEKQKAVKTVELEIIVGPLGRDAPARLVEAGAVGDLAKGTVESWLTKAAAQSPELSAKRSALSQAEQEVRIRQSEYLPKVEAIYAVGRVLDTGSLRTEDRSITRVASQQFGIRASGTLFSGGATMSRVREGIELRGRAQAEVDGAQRTLDGDVRRAFLSIRSGSAKVRALSELVRATSASVEAETQGFSLGTRSSGDLLDARKKLFKAKADLIVARYVTLSFAVQLRALTGELAQDGLRSLDLLFGSGARPARSLPGVNVPEAPTRRAPAPQERRAYPLERANTGAQALIR